MLAAPRGDRRNGVSGVQPDDSSHDVLSEKLFRDALVRERKRADRFEEAFVLVLISLDRRNAQPPRWEQLVEALSQSTLDADLIGWFEHGAVLGLIRSLDDSGLRRTRVAVAAAIQQELMRCLTSGQCGFLLDSPGDLFST